MRCSRCGLINTYRVLWRHDGRQRSLTFENLPAAERLKAMLEDTVPIGALRIIEARPDRLPRPDGATVGNLRTRDPATWACKPDDRGTSTLPVPSDLR